MTFRNWSVEKGERGFVITDTRDPVIASYPYIPKRRYKIMYPYVLIKSFGCVREYRRAFTT